MRQRLLLPLGSAGCAGMNWDELGRAAELVPRLQGQLQELSEFLFSKTQTMP